MFNHSAPQKRHAIKYGYKLAAEYDLEIHVSDACSSCYSREGLCELGKEGNFNCSITPVTEKGTNFFGPTVTHIY